MTHAFFRQKLEAVGYGVFVPFFFVSTGIKLDVSHLFHSGSALVRVPLFLGALLVVRGLPALLYRPFADRPGQLVAAGLLQATSLSIPVVAGLLSVIVFPLVSLTRLRGRADAASPIAGDGPAEAGMAGA